MNYTFAITLLLIISVCGCSGQTSPNPGKTTLLPGRSQNVLRNGGFETGIAPWYFLEGNPHWTGFTRSDSVVHSGKWSAGLFLDAGPEAAPVKVYGMIQEVSPDKFPDIISGYYRVEKWKRGTPKQYLQFVVIVWGDPKVGNWPNYQIRYILAGIDRPPFNLRNAKFIFVDPAAKEPIENKWIQFKRNISEDFKNLWGWVPSDFKKIRILFEARYDHKSKDPKRVVAQIYYDDLFFGWKNP